MILSLSCWPSWTTSPGWATRWWDSSLMWMSPSRPSRTRTNAPKLTSLVTVPSMMSPTLKSATVRMPRVGLQAADRQADPATLVVDVDDLGLDLVTDLVASFGVVDLVPRELALVDEAVDAAKVDEDAERRDAAHRAGDLLADLQAAEQLVALLAALLVEGHLLREDQAVGLAVDLQDLEPQLAADERLSFSAISWAASRGWSFWGRRGKSTIWLIGTKPRMPQSTMRPPLLWSMTGASMMTPASNCSCIARHLRSRPARRSERTAWPSGDSGCRT